MAIAYYNSFSQGDLTETHYANSYETAANDDLLGMYVTGLQESIQVSECQFYVEHPAASLDKLVSHARNTANIQRRSFGCRTSSLSSCTDAMLLT